MGNVPRPGEIRINPRRPAMLAQCLLLSLSVLSAEEPIDMFQYPDSAAAARAWVCSAGNPATVVPQGQRTVVEVALPFSDTKLERTIHDRNLSLDLASPGGFVLDLAVDDPEAVGQISLYFRSGNGWYSAGAGLVKQGRQTLSFSKASFHTEGNPAGWKKIDGVRISAWRGTNKDARLRLYRLAALRHEVALVIPAETGRERTTALAAADQVAEMLQSLGLGADAVEESAVVQGALEKRRVAILAHNPGLSDAAEKALVEFVELGGKVFVCYQLPPRLGQALGFGEPKYFRPDRPDLLAEIGFEGELPGAPKWVKQNSWNITTAKPVGQGARIVAHWYDSQRKPTGHPALLVSDRGAFFSHIVLGDDPEGKKQMLAAVLGQLEPALWRQMVQGDLDSLGRVGHLDSVEDLARYVEKSGNAAAKQRLAEAKTTLAMIDARIAKQAWPEAAELVRAARRQLAEAYLRAAPSRTVEGRGFWNHSGTGAYPGDWDRTCKELRAAGFNMVLPNMLWGGVAHYPSDVLPRSETFAKHGDQIAQCVAAGRKHGIEVHVWKVNFNLSGAPREFVDTMRKAGRTQVDADGRPVEWLCPSHPENVALERDSMVEVAAKYDVDGLHFDYIRYPDGDACYCDGCRERFEKERGAKVAHWPGDCYRGPRASEYRDWRCQQITRVVKEVSTAARKVKPKIKISAAVFSSYPGCRQSVGQDWVEWVRAGYVDFLCPMDYSESDLTFAVLVASQMKLVEGKIPLYPGIGATASRSTLPPDRVVGQIYQARQCGAGGFTVFNLSGGTIADIVPGVGLGATAKPAVPPHAKNGLQTPAAGR